MEQVVTQKTASPRAGKKGRTDKEVYLQIKNLISSGRLVPGQKLLYRDIAARLNVSITPVVQALKALESTKLVAHIPNRGYCVGEMTETEARALYEVREALELYCIAMIIKNMTPRNVLAAKNAFKEYKQGGTLDRRKLMLKDAEFHLKLIEMSGNTLIYKILEDIFEQTYFRYTPEYLEENRIRVAISEHRQIIRALEERDRRKAEVWLRKNIRNGMAHLVRHIAQAQANEAFLINFGGSTE